MSTRRVPMSPSFTAQILFASDHTCCKCRDPGRPVQIHHIDDDPGNNSVGNLAVLCLLCHNETQQHGGFGRRFSAELAREYRNDWAQRVELRRDKADELAALAMAPRGDLPSAKATPAVSLQVDTDPYIQSLPERLAQAYAVAQPRWDTGITSEMTMATVDVIDVVVQMLVQLGSRYPDNHFDGESPAQYFSEYVSARYRWHRLLIEPGGVGTGGTIVGPLTSLAVLKNLEQTVEDMVSSQISPEVQIDFQVWASAWRLHAEQ
jgi:hypothetical protein